MHGELLRQIILVSTLGVLLCGCATPTLKQVAVDPSLTGEEKRRQLELALTDYIDDMVRVSEVGSRIAIAARADCGDDLVPRIGIFVLNNALLTDEYRSVAKASFGVEGELKVLDVVPGLAASRAGVREGDIIRSVGAVRIPKGQDAVKLVSEALDTDATKPESIDMVVLRNGQDVTLQLKPDRACGHPIEFSIDESVNAFADGEKIYINKGLVRFAKNDDEFAMVVAHEFAHNLLEHRDSKVQNQIVGTVGGLVLDVLAAAAGVNTQGAFTEAGADVGAQAYSQEFESEADYLGLYILARAGYDIERAPNFFRRLGAANPTSILYARTHPTTAHRAVALTQAAREIRGKQLAGLPLLPDAAGDAADAPVAVAQSVSTEAVTTTAALAAPPPAHALVGADTEEWEAAGDSDGCEKPWSLKLSRAGDRVTGRLIRDEIAYELSGLVDPATDQVANGQAARASGGTSKLGPRWLGFGANLSEGDYQGRFWVATNGQRRCETEIKLSPSR